MKADGTRRRMVTAATRAREESLIAALLAGNTFASAAKVAGVATRTAYRLRQSEEFEAKYRRAKEELLGAAVAALHTRAMLFVETLAEVCRDPKARGSEKACAADRGLAALSRLVEQFDLAKRIGRLEELMGERQK